MYFRCKATDIIKALVATQAILPKLEDFDKQFEFYCILAANLEQNNWDKAIIKGITS